MYGQEDRWARLTPKLGSAPGGGEACEAPDEERWLAQKDVVSCHGRASARPFTYKESVSRLTRS